MRLHAAASYEALFSTFEKLLQPYTFQNLCCDKIFCEQSVGFNLLILLLQP